MNTAEIVPNKEELTEKQEAYAILRANGLDVKTASKTLGYHKHTGYNLEKKIKKYDLTDSKLVSKAHKAITNIMSGKTFGEIDNIKASDALAASKLVVDRHQPAVSLSISANIANPVDLSMFSGKSDSEENQ